MKRYYKKIDSTLELKNFDDLAAADGAVAVGVSNSGSLYKWNRESRRAEKINNSEAADILQVGATEIEAIITHRGAYEILEPVGKEEVQECIPEEVNTPTEEVVETPEQAISLKEIEDVVKDTHNLVTDLSKFVAEFRAESKQNHTLIMDKLIMDRLVALEETTKRTADAVDFIKKSFILE